MSDHPTYYAIIPASVRYDNSIPMGAKMMYGEITALSNTKGYCFASNGYFAKLYGVTNQAISKWIKQLEKAGHVRIEYISNNGVDQRRVSIVVNGYQQELRAVSTTVEGVSTTVEHNNINSNITSSLRKAGEETENSSSCSDSSLTNRPKKSKRRKTREEFDKYLAQVKLNFPTLYGSKTKVLLEEQHRVLTEYLKTLSEQRSNLLDGLVYKAHEDLNRWPGTRESYSATSDLINALIVARDFPTIQQMGKIINENTKLQNQQP